MEQNKNILNYLFICIVINIIPTVLLGEFNISNKIYTLLTIGVYVIQTLIMLWYIKDKIKTTSKKMVISIIIFFILQVITQIVNIVNFGIIEIKDIANILAVAINIYIFVYIASKFEVTKEQFVDFMKKMILLGVVSCIYNFIVNFETIINIFNIQNSYELNLKSFLANRNQYGIFLIIMLISNLYVMENTRKKVYILLQIVFIISVILTMSRNAIIGMLLIHILYLCFNAKNILQRMSKNQKILVLLIVLGILILISLIIIFVPSIMETIDKLFIRVYTINTETGRIRLWLDGIKMSKNNLITGIGRFKAIELNNTIYNSSLEQFHNIYIETFVTYGIIGLIYLIYFIVKFIKKIKDSAIDKKQKNIMLISVVVFLVISCFETTCRLSIGYADTISMIYFIAIPIIYSNIKGQKVEEENKCHKVKE